MKFKLFFELHFLKNFIIKFWNQKDEKIIQDSELPFSNFGNFSYLGCYHVKSGSFLPK